MKKFILKILLFSAPFLLIVSINLRIDNAYIFASEETYDEIGAIIAKGNNVANMYNFNEFLVRKSIVNNLEVKPNVICIGSSRSMQVNKSIFPDRLFFNASVSNTSLKELIAIYSVFHKQNIRPDTIIIGLDPWILVKKHDKLRNNFVEHYNYFIERTKIGDKNKGSHNNSKIYEMINPIYCYENIRYGEKEFFTTEEIFIEVNVLCNDGSLVYNSSKRNLNEQMVLKEAQSYNNRFDIDMRHNTIDNELKSLFENFIRLLNKESKIIFFFPPYHPLIAENFTEEKYSIINESYDYFINFSKSNNIDIIGNYNPSKCKFQLNAMDFYDGVHPKRVTVERLFNVYNKHRHTTKNIVHLADSTKNEDSSN